MGEGAWLSLLLWLPLFGALLLYFMRDADDRQCYHIALFTSLLVFMASLGTLALLDPHPVTRFGLEEMYTWLPSLHASWHLGMDSLSLWLVLLTTFLVPLAIRSSFGQATPTNYRTFLMLILGLETALIGVFISLDLVLFYIFWEAVLIPMYFLIGIWGGASRINSANKFFVYTMMGSLLMLLAIFALWHASEAKSFDYLVLLQDPGIRALPEGAQWWLFGAFALAFAIKVPVWPFHTWLPDAHTDAPTAASILLAGVLLKMGTYGLLRFNLPLFPLGYEQWRWTIGGLAVIGIVYGAWVATAQTDLKRLVAYSSVSHMGFVVLGIMAANVIGTTGATLQMINHGITTGALFMLVGFLYDRCHTREISSFQGIIQVMPVYAICFWITLFASIGLPGLNGFVGEFMIFIGSGQATREYTVIAITGVIWGAIYMLWVFQRVFLGKVDRSGPNGSLKDLDRHEFETILPLLILMVVLGIASPIISGPLQPTMRRIVERIHPAPAMAVVVVEPATPAATPAEPAPATEPVMEPAITEPAAEPTATTPSGTPPTDTTPPAATPPADDATEAGHD
ncbi:MAG: NADH-quinone oxidoreductase subunit M [bacterium]